MFPDVLEDAHLGVDLAVVHAAQEKVGLADEVGDEGRRGRVVDGLGCVHLLQPPVVQHGDPIGHGEGFVVVVRDEHSRRAGEPEDFLHLLPHLTPHVGIQVAERLVQEQYDGFGGERAGERHPLLLAAGELVRVAVLEARESNEVQRLSDHVHGSRLLQAPQPEGDVLRHGEVREQRVVLKDHAHAALLRHHPMGSVADRPAGDRDRASLGPLESGDGPEHRGLAATAGAQDGQGGAFFHGEREIGQGRRGGMGIGERDLGQLNQRHTSFFSRSRATTIHGNAVNAMSSRAMTAARAYSASTVWM